MIKKCKIWWQNYFVQRLDFDENFHQKRYFVFFSWRQPPPKLLLFFLQTFPFSMNPGIGHRASSIRSSPCIGHRRSTFKRTSIRHRPSSKKSSPYIGHRPWNGTTFELLDLWVVSLINNITMKIHHSYASPILVPTNMRRSSRVRMCENFPMCIYHFSVFIMCISM